MNAVHHDGLWERRLDFYVPKTAKSLLKTRENTLYLQKNPHDNALYVQKGQGGALTFYMGCDQDLMGGGG